MGKSSAPLHFLTTPDFYHEHQEEFDDLKDKGHTVSVGDYCDEHCDIILDPKAWRTWTDPVTGRIANLDMAIKAARVAKKLREKESKQ